MEVAGGQDPCPQAAFRSAGAQQGPSVQRDDTVSDSGFQTAWQTAG